LRTESTPLGALACPTDDPDTGFLVPPASRPKRRYTPRTRRPRAELMAEVAVGTRLRAPDYARLMSHLATTGERPAVFLRRAILALLDASSTSSHA